MVKNPPANAGSIVRFGLDPWVWKIPWRRAWQPAPVFFPRESHGQRRLSGCSPCRDHKESNTTEVMLHACTSYYGKEWKSYLLHLKLETSLGSFLSLAHDNVRKSSWLYLQNLSRILPLLTAFPDTMLTRATSIFYLPTAVASKLVFQLLHFFTTV